MDTFEPFSDLLNLEMPYSDTVSQSQSPMQVPPQRFLNQSVEEKYNRAYLYESATIRHFCIREK